MNLVALVNKPCSRARISNIKDYMYMLLLQPQQLYKGIRHRCIYN
jgi:hypothetical protein